MSIVITSPNFEKEAKRLIKKYRSLAQELAVLIDDLAKNQTQRESLFKPPKKATK